MSQQKTAERSIVSLIVIYALEAIAANLAHPITPNLLEALKMPNYMFGVVFAAMSVTNFALSPFWGSLCNYVSARKILLISCIGYAIGQAIFGFATTQFLITLGRLISGLFVSGISIGTTYYVIQYSSEAKRAQNITATITTFTVAGTFGYFLGGYIGNTSLTLPFILQCGLLTLCGFLFYIFLKENKIDRDASLSKIVKKSNPIGAFIQIKQYLTPTITLLFITVLSVSLASTSLTQSFSYYIQNTLRLSPLINGITKGIVGILALIANFTLTLYLLRSKDVEKYVIFILSGLSTMLVGMILFSHNVNMFLLFGVTAMVFDTIQISMLQDRNASYATKESQGSMLGTHNAMKGLGMIIGSLFSGFIYEFNPIFPFTLSLGLYLIGIVTMYCLRKEQYQNERI